MRRLFESGIGFMIVAILCFFAAIIAEKNKVFVPIGSFWLIFGIIVASRNKEKHKGPDAERSRE